MVSTITAKTPEVACDGLPPYIEKMKTSDKVQTKHWVIVAVAAIFVVAMVIGGALFGVYMKNKHLVTITVNTKNGGENIRVDPEKGEEEYELQDWKFTILYDFHRGLTLFKTSVTCYLQPLNRTGMMSPAALANFIRKRQVVMDRDQEETEYYYVRRVDSRKVDTSFISDRARAICNGLPVYWNKLNGPYSELARHGGRQERRTRVCILVFYKGRLVCVIVIEFEK